MFKVGIIGAGSIAHKMAEALAPLDDYGVYAIASRDRQKADEFAARWNVAKSYGSYETMVEDEEIDLVYVATPHSHHYDHALLAVRHGKPVLVEKSFTANARQARELLDEARRAGVFVTEAIWTRYMPMSHKVKQLLDGGAIGEPKLLTATLCYMIGHKERCWRTDLCGGALLDLGVYPINFARMYFGTDIAKVVSNCVMNEEGIDLQECISMTYTDGRMANLQAGMLCLNDRQGIISGTEGYIRVDNINCPECIEVYRNYECVERIDRPKDMVNGYEYQVYECRHCIEAGLLESPMMPWAETIAIMEQMDALRKEWGVVYPMD